jgi:molybdopterin molybdotransferase
MISVEQALEKVLSNTVVLKSEEKPILEAMGQVLAEDIYATIDVPPLDNSAMDGYAVRSEDTHGASPRSPRHLRVIDTVMAGSISRQKVNPGTAIRIMTGAPVPEGADAIVRFEDTDDAGLKEPSVETGILREVIAGLDIRRSGESIAKGSLVLEKGNIINPAEIGVLASLGLSKVTVIRRPEVAVLVTGEELVNADQPLPQGKIYDSNSFSVAAMVKYYGGVPRLLGVAMDNADSLYAGLQQGLDADVLITTGGVSMGDYDIVKDVLAREGDIIFWKVRMKPGKPVAFGKISRATDTGTLRKTLHLGLPGNPVSVMITFELFARPVILKMMGKKNLAKPTIEAVIEEPIINEDGRRIFARAIIEKRNGQYSARLTGPQGSGILTSMTSANGLVIVPEDKPRVDKGEVVQVMMLDWIGESKF